MIVRNLLGVLLAVAIAMIARRARSLTTSGAMAAAVAGSVAVAVGWSWGITLILYFASSTLLSRLGRVEKERRTRAVVAKGGERDAWQVLAMAADDTAMRPAKALFGYSILYLFAIFALYLADALIARAAA